MTYVINIKEVT